MLRSALSKVMWVGRATVFLVGIAVILALLFGATTTALAGTGVGATFNLGQKNTVDRLSQLAGSTAGALLRVDNNGAGTALDLKVGDPAANPATKTTPPMKVDSQAKVANLNSDQIDGLNSTDFVQGSGVAISAARSVTKGDFVYLYDAFQKDRLGFNVAYKCPDPLTNQGLLRFTNYTPGTVNLFSDNGSADPVYTQVAPGGSGASSDYDQPTNPSGERITFQVQGARVGTIEVFSVHRANDCHAQAQALVTP
jgi:hypothetical protein